MRLLKITAETYILVCLRLSTPRNQTIMKNKEFEIELYLSYADSDLVYPLNWLRFLINAFYEPQKNMMLHQTLQACNM